MAKSLDDVKRELRSRLEELRPLVDEYEQLQRAADALGIPGDEPRPAKRAAASRGRGAGKRAPRGENKQAVFRVISERPGVSVGEIAQVTGIGNPLVYGVTRNGVSRGELQAVDLGGGRKGFKLADADGASGGKDLEEATAGIDDDQEPAPVGG